MSQGVSENKNFCRCGCGTEIPFVSKCRGLQRFAHNHHSKGMNHGMWKGGKVATTQGYFKNMKKDHHFADNDGYVHEHRLVWEEHNNAVLLSWADVHHINGNKQDNRIENLEAMMHRQHTTRHTSGHRFALRRHKDMSNRFCMVCESNITSFDQGFPIWYKGPIVGQWICKKCHRHQYWLSKHK